MPVKEDKLSKKMESVVTALITPNQSEKSTILITRSGEQFALLSVSLMKGYWSMEIVNSAHHPQDFRKTNGLVVTYLVNTIKLRQMMDHAKIAHLTQDHVQMKQGQKFARQTVAPRGKN
jgi:phage-related protein